MKLPIDEVVNVAGLSAEDQKLVLDHACYMLHQDCDVDVSKYHVALREGDSLPLQDQQRLQPLFRSEKMIDEHPVAAMLVSDIEGSYQEKNKHRRLKRYVLKGAFRFPDKGPAIKTACRRVRHLSGKKTRWILDALPEEPFTLSDVVSNLNNLEREIEEETDSDAKRWKLRRCEDLAPLLRWLNNDHATKRGGGKRTKTSSEEEATVVSKIDDDIGDDDLNGCVVQAVSLAKGSAADAEPIESQRYFDPGLQTAASYRSFEAKQRRNARYATNEMRSRAVAAPCGWQGLTDNEVRIALSECVSSAINDKSPAHALVVLSVLLGRRPTDLLALPFLTRRSSDPENGYWYLLKRSIRFVVVLKMPRFKINEFSAQVTDTSVTQIELPIPKSFYPTLRALQALKPRQRQPNSSIANEVKNLLSAINMMYCTRLTEPRLAAFMQAHLAGEGLDDVAIRRIRGFQLFHNVPQHYDGCPAKQTLGIYTAYAEKVLSWCDLDGDLEAVSCRAAPFGSRLQLHGRYVRKYFETWSSHIDDIRTTWRSLNFHNEYALATYSILSVATGHRPVTRMFENIRDYDPISRELFVADKNSSNSADSRCIVLGDIAAQQLDNYIAHLRQLELKVGAGNITTVRAAKRALNGTGPLLFRVFREKNRHDTIQEFDPGLIEDWLADKWPIDLKWARHFLRTKACEGGLPFEGTNATLGHNGGGPANFNPFSGTSYRDLARYSECYNAILREHGVEPIRGLAS